MEPPPRGSSASSLPIQVLALTSFKEEILVQSALQAGAIGYLLKDVSADELAQAIRAAHAGRATLSPEAAQALVHAASQPPAPGLDLTEREREVLALMVEGLEQYTDRRKADRQSIHRQIPRQQHPVQIGRCQPHGSRHPGAAQPHYPLTLHLPQVAETNTPRPMDVAGECFYNEKEFGKRNPVIMFKR